MRETKLLSENLWEGRRRQEEVGGAKGVVRKVGAVHRGMTLIELLVVISIIAALAGLTYSAVMQARKRAYLATCINNLRQLVLAVHAYENDWGMVPIEDVQETPEGLYGFYPQILHPYIRDESILLCPEDDGEPNHCSVTWKGREWKASYYYFVNGETLEIYKVTPPFPDMVLFLCTSHDKVYIISRYDGRIEIAPWGRYKKISIITEP